MASVAAIRPLMPGIGGKGRNGGDPAGLPACRHPGRDRPRIGGEGVHRMRGRRRGTGKGAAPGLARPRAGCLEAACDASGRAAPAGPETLPDPAVIRHEGAGPASRNDARKGDHGHLVKIMAGGAHVPGSGIGLPHGVFPTRHETGPAELEIRDFRGDGSGTAQLPVDGTSRCR